MTTGVCGAFRTLGCVGGIAGKAFTNRHAKIVRDVSWRALAKSADMAYSVAADTNCRSANVPSVHDQSHFRLPLRVIGFHIASRGLRYSRSIRCGRSSVELPDKYPAASAAVRLYTIGWYPYVFEISAAVREGDAIQMCGRTIGRLGHRSC